jgi:GNAT superfamily N-acetyltransferase
MKAFRGIGPISAIQIVQTEPYEAEVTDFYVDPDDRGNKIGTRLMKATCRDADREGVTLFLSPLPFGTYDKETEEFNPPDLTYKQLCDFYRSFGFRFRRKPFEDVMMRTPKSI